jgi:hypothetical protein
VDIKLDEFSKRFDRVTLEFRPVAPDRPKAWRVSLEEARDQSDDVEGWGSTPISAVYDAAYRLPSPG